MTTEIGERAWLEASGTLECRLGKKGEVGLMASGKAVTGQEFSVSLQVRGGRWTRAGGRTGGGGGEVAFEMGNFRGGTVSGEDEGQAR